VAASSKAWVCGRSLTGIAGSNPPGAWGSVLSVVCCTGRGLCVGLITRPEESYRMWCFVECDLETSRMRLGWPALGRRATGRKVMLNTGNLFRVRWVSIKISLSAVSSTSHSSELQVKVKLCGNGVLASLALNVGG
jgi:hypothetical protein